MADLSADEAQRLARQFLTGKAGAPELARIATYLPEDQTLALELLAQMQAALDDVAPSALNAEQDKSVDARIEALIGPRIKKRGLMGWLRKLFGRKAKPVEEAPASRRKGRAEAARPAPEPVAPVAAVEPVSEDGLEDVMPGVTPAPVEAPAPVADAPAKPAPKEKAPRKPLPWKALGLALLALLLLGGLGLGIRWWLNRPKPVAVQPAAVAATPVPTPQATPSPTPVVNAQPVRARAVTGLSDEPLPSELPFATPQPAGLLSPEP